MYVSSLVVTKASDFQVFLYLCKQYQVLKRGIKQEVKKQTNKTTTTIVGLHNLTVVPIYGPHNINTRAYIHTDLQAG